MTTTPLTVPGSSRAAEAPGVSRPEDQRAFVASQFEALLRNPLFPCTLARGAATKGQVTTAVHDDLADPGVAQRVLDDLYGFVARGSLERPGYSSFAAVFTEPRCTDETRYESLLWGLLQRLHDLDRPRHGWDPSVSHDPASGDFSFSVAGRAFFVVGLHPGASRLSRRFAFPAVVFNSHAQFERLRARGAYTGVRDRIRANDVRLQGSVNPVLEDHGGSSEARQYSGRPVEADWRCPMSVGAAPQRPSAA